MITRNTYLQKTPSENLTASLAQKDKIISILQNQLQGLVNIREGYDRLKDRKIQLQDRCDGLERQINIKRDNQGTKVDNTQKNIIDLKILVSSLQAELQNKQYQLRDLKCQAQTLVKTSEQRNNDVLQYNQSIQSVHSSMEILKMESERLNSGIVQVKDQIQRIKQYQQQTDQANDKIRSQNHNTQSFIRKLVFQENKYTESLTILQDRNNAIDQIIEDLNKVQDETKNKIKQVRDQNEESNIRIKGKQSQKGRISAQYNMKLKQFKNQKQKQKALTDATTTIRQQLTKLGTIQKQLNSQNQQFTQSNLQIESINTQLKNDLFLCKKHLQNVTRNNESLKQNLSAFLKINTSAIKKLRRPVDECWSELHTVNTVNTGSHLNNASKKQLADLETGEGFLERSI